MCKKLLNEELNGIELYFNEIPSAETREILKSAGFRWHKVKKCWYAKKNEETTKIAQELSDEEITAANIKKSVVKTSKLAPLWERCQVSEIPAHDRYLTTKEIAEQTRKHIKERFPEIKFSCRIGSGGWAAHNEVNFYFKSAPFSKDSAYFEAIKNYVKCWLWSFNYDNSDSMTDYFDRGFYENISTWDFEECEPTKEQREEMSDFDKKAEEAKKAEEERQRAKFEEWQKEREEEIKRAEIRRKKEEADRIKILDEIKIVDIAESEKYIITANMVCGCGKDNNIEEVKKDGYKKEESAIIKREVYFTSEENYNNFCNLLMYDWEFCNGCGGTGTLDKRVNDDNFNKLNASQRDGVKWLLWDCVAVYLNNKLMLIIDPEGYNYCRYANIVEGQIKKELLKHAEQAEDEKQRDAFHMPESIQSQADNIESGNIYTLIYNDPWTLCATMHHITINSITKTTYAQHKDAILLNYTEKGKRKAIQQYFYNSKSMLLFAGWLEALPEELTKKHISGNMYQVLNAGATSNDFMITCAKYYESNGHNAIINTLQY